MCVSVVLVSSIIAVGCKMAPWLWFVLPPIADCITICRSTADAEKRVVINAIFAAEGAIELLPYSKHVSTRWVTGLCDVSILKSRYVKETNENNIVL